MRPLPPQRGQMFSPVPGVPGGASSPGLIGASGREASGLPRGAATGGASRRAPSFDALIRHASLLS
jgi:hypothetical protein